MEMRAPWDSSVQQWFTKYMIRTSPCPVVGRSVCRRAYAALAKFTKKTVAELQADDDELLKGVDWATVIAGETVGVVIKLSTCMV